MTAVDLDALDAARAAATPGPWAQHPSDGEYVIGQVRKDDEDELDYLDIADTYAFRKDGGLADAALIVAAVNVLPDLIADARKLRALCEAVEGLAKKYKFLGEDEEMHPRAADAFSDASLDLYRALAAALTSEGERE